MHGLQQNSQDPPPPVGHSMQPVLGFATELVDELEEEVGRTASIGVVAAEEAIRMWRVDLGVGLYRGLGNWV